MLAEKAAQLNRQRVPVIELGQESMLIWEAELIQSSLLPDLQLAVCGIFDAV